MPLDGWDKNEGPTTTRHNYRAWIPTVEASEFESTSNHERATKNIHTSTTQSNIPVIQTNPPLRNQIKSKLIQGTIDRPRIAQRLAVRFPDQECDMVYDKNHWPRKDYMESTGNMDYRMNWKRRAAKTNTTVQPTLNLAGEPASMTKFYKL